MEPRNGEQLEHAIIHSVSSIAYQNTEVLSHTKLASAAIP